MKINGFFINEKKYLYKKILITLIIYIIGIILGAVYCTLIASQFDASLSSYLSDFFTRINAEAQYLETLKNSLFKNIRLFVIIFIFSYFKIGSVLISSTVGIKGFVAGFASGIFIKYYSFKGILLPLSSLFSNILFLPTLFLFATVSSMLSRDRKNIDLKRRKKYVLLSICCLTIFCVSSVFDCFVTTTFMKLISSFFVN